MYKRNPTDFADEEIVATITSKGQVTVPIAVRRHLGVGAHDQVAFVFDESGAVKLSSPRYPTIASLRGIAGSLSQPMTWQEIEDIAQSEHAEEVARSR
jgi:antitoxin PrlF